MPVAKIPRSGLEESSEQCVVEILAPNSRTPDLLDIDYSAGWVEQERSACAENLRPMMVSAMDPLALQAGEVDCIATIEAEVDQTQVLRPERLQTRDLEDAHLDLLNESLVMESVER